MALEPRVDSEVGTLREVIVHRPGREIERLTPSNHDELLFDDILDPGRARDEHDYFVDVLENAGVQVLHFRQLLTDVLHNPQARENVLDRTLNERRLGPILTPALKEWTNSLSAEELTAVCVEGLTIDEWKMVSPVRSLVTRTLEDNEFLIRPLPNHLFTRDASAWIHKGVAVNSMSRLARERESLHYSTIYRYHPRFTAAPFDFWSLGTSGAIRSAEGGDALIVGERTAVFGVSERSTPQGVERLAVKLFEASQAESVMAVVLPNKRAFMHLDTVLTQVDADAFLAYPHIGDIRTMFITPGTDGSLHVKDMGSDLLHSLEVLMERPIRFISPQNASTAELEREQWNDGFNCLAIAPGRVITFDRSPRANDALREHGVEVTEIRGDELGRGRGGPRCMSCPVVRDPLPN